MKKNGQINSSKGFTLIELLIVIAIIAVLAISVFVALNPAKRVSDANDSRRKTDVENILNAIHSYVVDNDGDYPTGLSVSMDEAQLGTAATGAAIATGGCAVTEDAALNLATPLAEYLKSIPFDPQGTAALTGYSVVVDANGIVTVKACAAQGGDNISVSM